MCRLRLLGGGRGARSVATVLIGLLVVLVWPVAAAPRALACSCAFRDAPDVVATSAAAFVGIATHVHGEEIDLGGRPVVAVEFEVIEPVKGNMGDRVVLVVHSTATSCGPPLFLPGEQTVFGRRSSVIVGNGLIAHDACIDLDPSFLTDVDLEVLAAPDITVAAEVAVVGQRSGTDLRLYGIGESVVGYGQSNEIAGHTAAVCGDTDVLATTRSIGRTEHIVWRDIESLTVLHETALARDHRESYTFGTGVVSCNDDLRVVAVDNDGWHVVDPSGPVSTVARNAHRFATTNDLSVGATAELNGDVVIRDLNTDSELGRILDSELGPGLTWGLAFNPTGSRLAIMTNNGNPQLTITDPVGRIEIDMALTDPDAWRLWWLDDTTLVYAGTPTSVMHLPPSTDADPARWPIDQVPGTYVGHAGTRVLTRSSDTDLTITDLATGQTTPIRLPENTGPKPILLPRPVTVANNFVPPAESPAPGVTLPATIDELRAALSPPPTAALDDPTPTPSAHTTQPWHTRPQTWIPALAAAITATALWLTLAPSRRAITDRND